MAGPQLFTIVDDSRSDSFVFGPLEWTGTSFPGWFNSTSQSPAFAVNQDYPWGTVTMGFKGTSVALFGNTPAGGSSAQTFTVSIDGESSYNTTYGDPNPPTYGQWYQSPLLEEGNHSIVLSNIAGGTSVDFAVVTVGEDTALNGTVVIADNDDLGFNYTGQWRRSQDPFNSGPQPDGNPYHNSTHQTSDVGNFFTYQFSGSSAAIYGIFTWSNLGVMSLTFTLDGESLTQTYTVLPDTPQFISELGQQQNFLFYEYSFLQAGSHTLVVNLTECVNQTFAFDYTTFAPSFATLAAMPNLTSINTANTDLMMSKNSHTGIIAAALGAAGIAFLLCGIFVFFKRRQRIKGGRYKPVYPFRHDRHSNGLTTTTSPHPFPDSIHMNVRSMQLTQNTSAAHRSLAFPFEPEVLAPLRPLRRNGPLLTSSSTATFGVTDAIPLSGTADTTSVIPPGTPGTWMGSDILDTLPPSYDESTRGQSPPLITYYIPR